MRILTSHRTGGRARATIGRIAGTFGLLAALWSLPVQAQGPVPAQAVASPAAPTVEVLPATIGVEVKPEAAAGAAPLAAGASPAPAAKPHRDLSPLGMFLNADPVVQGVMVLLAAASVLTWTILLARALGLLLAKRRLRASLAAIRAATSLDDAAHQVRHGLGAQLLVETEEELALSQGLPSEGIKERVAIALERIEAAAAKRMAVGISILATIGSVGPFVGLFGTVWGIMRSFIGIANSNTTNLAVVAPGIAEALLATGIGLVAAIPAVVIYNGLARSVVAYRMLATDAVALIMRHLSRDLDRREAGTFPAPGKAARLRVAAE
ncbi:tonB-system energizer ExbB [Methylobacterium sp. E-041]|uniref:tonB-system energizer ExbB n=1 Tax=Methylobacterium sp. E-041 TaxID=2836573 RepID=UPI001FB8D16D|nr:tonB-system energizer ExbB [Methylobacterium sp. E-041]